MRCSFLVKEWLKVWLRKCFGPVAQENVVTMGVFRSEAYY